MDFELNENQKMITQMIRDFADKNIRPRIMGWDESQEFQVGIMRSRVSAVFLQTGQRESWAANCRKHSQ